MKFVIIGLFSVVILVLAFGYFLPSERSAIRKTIINAPPEKVFAKVSDISNQKWRTQLVEIQILDAKAGHEIWIEKPKRGPEIKFRTKLKNPPYHFEIEIIDNPQFGGYWVGKFSETSDGNTEITFSEHAVVNGIFPKILSYIFFNIDDSVDSYVRDLKKAVE